MADTNAALTHLTQAAQALSKAFAAARDSGCDVASQIIARASVINASAIEELINAVASAGGSSCAHELIEVLSSNGRNLDNAVRRCARCEAVQL